ncbi:Uncharacterized protein APZ42_027362 [Daphnia magna]|uniref:Uncharacterized protein n=1 Tax=Daphnia magna TaxID=35525 RepID=A0A164RI98_9CRUS|nr:Uncharacterized protein APZ42_027362 [Daphnia magna]
MHAGKTCVPKGKEQKKREEMYEEVKEDVEKERRRKKKKKRKEHLTPTPPPPPLAINLVRVDGPSTPKHIHTPFALSVSNSV